MYKDLFLFKLHFRLNFNVLSFKVSFFMNNIIYYNEDYFTNLLKNLDKFFNKITLN